MNSDFSIYNPNPMSSSKRNAYNNREKLKTLTNWSPYSWIVISDILNFSFLLKLILNFNTFSVKFLSILLHLVRNWWFISKITEVGCPKCKEQQRAGMPCSWRAMEGPCSIRWLYFFTEQSYLLAKCLININ